ncbi:GNAT family N-acetyltransferase [Candidatus Woesearchaeota archaeon]|nr:GNAT family N-acetyltransferase [Candidatus Woesearchaeota archaeon]
MEVKSADVPAAGIKFYAEQDGREVARVFLYVLTNELHPAPFGFMEDVFVEEQMRGKGIGSALVEQVIEEAQRRGCYKLICTSRHEKDAVHDMYMRLGFTDHGKEFRINFYAT